MRLWLRLGVRAVGCLLPCGGAAQALEKNGVVISREQWLGFAETAERSQMPATAR